MGKIGNPPQFAPSLCCSWIRHCVQVAYHLNPVAADARAVGHQLDTCASLVAYLRAAVPSALASRRPSLTSLRDDPDDEAGLFTAADPVPREDPPPEPPVGRGRRLE